MRLRPAEDADRDFLLALYATTRASEMQLVAWDDETKRAFIAQQFAAQDDHYRRHYPNRTFDIIEVDGRPAGRLYVNRETHDIRVVDITIAPAYRGQGLGTAVLRELLAEAEATGRSVSIHVEVNNPARSLYNRLGFQPKGEHGLYVLMQWAP